MKEHIETKLLRGDGVLMRITASQASRFAWLIVRKIEMKDRSPPPIDEKEFIENYNNEDFGYCIITFEIEECHLEKNTGRFINPDHLIDLTFETAFSIASVKRRLAERGYDSNKLQEEWRDEDCPL